MTFNDFSVSLNKDSPPQALSQELQALWWDGKGDWNKSHEIVQDLPGKEAAWVHAYLHRKEGDIWNADYWYSRAGRVRPTTSIEEEWADLVQKLLP